MADGDVKAVGTGNSPWKLDLGVSFDVAGSNTYQFDDITGLAPIKYNQVGLPLPDVHLGVGYEIPIRNFLGGSNLRFNAGIYGSWEHMRSNGAYDPNSYGACDATEDPTCQEDENNETEKNTVTAWRDGLYLSAEFTRPIVLKGGFEIPLGLRYTERVGFTSFHNSAGEFYAGATMPHNEGEPSAVLVDNQHRIGAILGFAEVGLSIDGGTNSPMNSDIGNPDMKDAAFISSDIPSTLEQTGGQVGAYVEFDVGRLIMAATKKK
jgi:hypothetical protein